MNDSNFSNDTYFYFQDLSTSHLVEAEPTNNFNYFNSINNSFHNQQQQQQQHQQPQQQQHSAHHLQHVGHVQSTALHCNLNDSTNNNSSSHNNNSNNNNNNNNSSNTLNSLPFVQIHTTDVHPARSSYGNVFRRQTANQAEIKSEPIKSESAENNTKDNANTTPTPPNAQVGGSGRSSNASNEPTSNISTNGNCCNEQLTEQQDLSNAKKANKNHENTNGNLQSDHANSSLPAVYKCSQCPFISLSEAAVAQHADARHHNNNDYFPTENRTRIKCPGCANIFYAHNSLFVHLCEDHQMCLDEANKLLQAYEQYNQLPPQTKHSVEEQPHTKEVQPKIFLKNVACLRDPAPRVLDEQLLQLNDSNYFQLTDFDDGCNALLTDVVAAESDYLGLVPNVSAKDLTLDVNANLPKQQQTSTTKQKISIKSVDVLREPALLRRDFEMQHLNILSASVGAGAAAGQCNEHELSEALEADNQYNFGNNIDMDHNDLVANELSAFEKPRRPKIYIKNVDILKEPLVLPSNLSGATGGLDFNFMSQSMQQQNAGNFLSKSDAEVATQAQNQVFDGSAHLCIPNMVEPPLLYDGSSNNTFLQNISDLDSYALGQNNTNNFLLQSPKYQSELQANLEAAASEPAPIVIESTPPPPLPTMLEQHPIEYQTAATSQQKQKIFIKNAEILKQPQFQEQRRTLHLRTVDELNLMNKTEVENLIAPNLDASQNQDYIENNNNNNNNIDNNINNHNHNNNMNASAENSKNSEETGSYSSLNLKINEAEDTQTLHNWTSGYSLGAELDCIITEHTHSIGMPSDTDLALQKQLYDLETPQMSVISVLDIEELTDEQETSSRNALTETPATQFALNTPASEPDDVLFTHNHAVDILMHTAETLESTVAADMQHNSEQHETNSCHSPAAMMAMPGELKREQISNINTSESCTPVSEKSELIYASTTTSPALSDAEPFATNVAKKTAALPMPAMGVNSPSGTLQNTMTLKPATTATAAPEKGRIYVADNLLMEVAAEKATDATEHPVAVSITGGTSNRGRPFGSNRTGITKIRKLYGNAAAIDVGMKCNVQGCAFRFKKPETLDYHKRCHTSSTMSTQAMICPECQSTNFSNWNTLHTHLWRTHQIDMELYSCELCQFKTPIYSRLINTHSKIHSDERNYKCDQCDKAFKNSKQLKNHRRWHRNAVAVATTATASLVTSTNRSATTLHRCNDCGSAFSHQKTLREHMCKQNVDAQKVMRCELCDRIVSSKSSLKLHMRTHEAASRFKCTVCDYRANDHNAFRRHKMTHEKSKMYICPFCDYKSIQSIAYQKHLQQKHPELVDNIVHKCGECNFSTINRSLLTIHMAKHSNTEDATQTFREPRPANDATMRFAHTALSIDGLHHNNETETSAQLQQQQQQQQQRNKIKVKSDLVLTDPAKFTKNTNSNSVTSLLVHCFDNAIT